MAVAEDDVAEGVLQKWNADTTLANVSIARGRLTATVSATPPYCQLEVSDGDKKPEFSTGGPVVVWTGVKLMIRGLEVDVRNTVDRVQAVFDPQPDGSNTLAIPNSQTLVCWRPTPPHLEQDPATKSGQDIWTGTVTYQVMHQRSWGGN